MTNLADRLKDLTFSSVELCGQKTFKLGDRITRFTPEENALLSVAAFHIETLERENEELLAADRVHLSAKQGMERRLTARIEALEAALLPFAKAWCEAMTVTDRSHASVADVVAVARDRISSADLKNAVRFARKAPE